VALWSQALYEFIYERTQDTNSRDSNEYILIADLLHSRIISSLLSSVICRYKLYVDSNELLPSCSNLTGCRSIDFLFYRCGGVYAIYWVPRVKLACWIGFTFCAFNLNWVATLSVQRKFNLTANYPRRRNIYSSQLHSLSWQPNKQLAKYINNIKKTIARGKMWMAEFPRIANGLQSFAARNN